MSAKNKGEGQAPGGSAGEAARSSEGNCRKQKWMRLRNRRMQQRKPRRQQGRREAFLCALRSSRRSAIQWVIPCRACLMMICSNGPSLDQKEEVEKFLLAVVARFKSFRKRVPSKSFVGKRPRCASASKAKSSVLSELSGLEHVLFNDFTISSTMSST
jgi:hypothetical protein